LHSEYMSN